MLNKCLEPLTAISCAICAGAIGLLDGGITVGAIIGGSALIARFREQSEKHGLDSTKLIEKTRLAVIRTSDTVEQTQEQRDAIGAADSAMEKYLAECMPSREALAATALEGESVYPAEAAALVVAKLAEHNDECRALFAEAGPARDFALTAVEAALRIAKDDPDYAPLLTLDLVIEVAGATGRIERGQEADRKRDEVFQTEASATLKQILAAVGPEAKARAVTEEALIALARRIAEKVEDAGQALEELRRAIDEFIRLRERAAQGTNLGDLVDETLRRIAAANERGALDEGAREGERAFATWREQQEQARQAGLRLVEANLEQHRLRFDAEAMADWICERLMLEGGGVLDFEILRAEQDRWYELGLFRVLPLELEVSVALARRSVLAAQNESELASGQSDLAIALGKQGERKGGTAGLAHLAEAVRGFREVLSVYTKEPLSSEWVITQNNLGSTLAVQGALTMGDAALNLLAEAVLVFRGALTVYTKDALPREWAKTQNNIGNVLAVQGERTGGTTGRALLAEAVSAYLSALTVLSKEEMPGDWALTQNNLGDALRAQGEQTFGDEGLSLLTDAVTAFRAALTIHTKDAMLANWATTQHNLGLALASQGERTPDDKGLLLLTEAVSVFRAALTVLTPERFGLLHPITAGRLARAEALIAERSA